MPTKTFVDLTFDLVTLMAETSLLIDSVQPDAPTTAECMCKALERMHEAHHWLTSAPELEDRVSDRIAQLTEERSMQLKLSMDINKLERDALSQVLHRKVDQLPDHG